ncbi:sulfurtransferase [Frondihabitans cladoniiphilus]|uniref:Sulfurtransferase n=1 Tax=Frondihabitans cladoniiphilus TaxID=715785 RepID=A0ABP8VTD7_9MICO
MTSDPTSDPARDLLIRPVDLARLRDERGAAVVVLDVRWRLDRPGAGPADFAEAHLPGAIFVALDTELAAHGAPSEGRHPLPAVADLQESARVWGIDADSTVVVYDDSANMASARAWWLLRYAGVADVRLLDGALAGWREAGLPLETGPGHPPLRSGSVVLEYGHLPVLDADGAADVASSGTLVDSRAGERYRGEVEPIDPKAGHVPGAVSVPTGGNVDADGRFLAPEALRARFETAGITRDAPLGVYCGSGVTAAHNAVAMTLAGFEPAVFPGSWSAWSNSDRPVATGASPEGD